MPFGARLAVPRGVRRTVSSSAALALLVAAALGASCMWQRATSVPDAPPGAPAYWESELPRPAPGTRFEDWPELDAGRADASAAPPADGGEDAGAPDDAGPSLDAGADGGAMPERRRTEVPTLEPPLRDRGGPRPSPKNPDAHAPMRLVNGEPVDGGNPHDRTP
jgi:hypothetical protein